jgi:hypothetical protein
VGDQEMLQRIKAVFATGDPQEFARAQYEVSAEDVVQEWPQSGERIRGRENIRAINENYPAGPGGAQPHMTLRRILEPGKAWVLESTIDYGDGVPVSAVSIIESRDGKIVKETDYFANPFEAPEWRKQWVESMEPTPIRVG